MISVYTPIHPIGLPYLNDAYASLKRQTHTNWEWVLVPNCGAIIPPSIASDPQVRVHEFDTEAPGGALINGHHRLGAIKKFAVELCRGDIYLELDGDDILVPHCLERAQQEFDKGYQFVYSNHAEFKQDTWEPHAYSDYYGWRQRPFTYQGHKLIEMISFDPSPAMLRLIMWAPNHIRAWTREAYWKSGGYDSNMVLGADHNLCVRTYISIGGKAMKRIDECLYLYRLHGENSCIKYNQDVQGRSWQNYHDYIEPMVKRWCDEEGLRAVDLGGGIDPYPGLEAIDVAGGDVQADLNERWPFDDDSIGLVRANHVFEHLRDPLHTMNELYRVLAPGGFAMIEVPSTDGRGAFQDPTHVSYWNENSFLYYTDRKYARYTPAFNGRFQAVHLRTYTPSWGREIKVILTRAHLVCLKPPFADRVPGEIKI